MYLLDETLLNNINVNVNDYLKNTSDGLELKRKILKDIENKGYQYHININLVIDNSKCKNKEVFRIFHREVQKEYNRKLHKGFIVN